MVFILHVGNPRLYKYVSRGVYCSPQLRRVYTFITSAYFRLYFSRRTFSLMECTSLAVGITSREQNVCKI